MKRFDENKRRVGILLLLAFLRFLLKASNPTRLIFNSDKLKKTFQKNNLIQNNLKIILQKGGQKWLVHHI